MESAHGAPIATAAAWVPEGLPALVRDDAILLTNTCAVLEERRTSQGERWVEARESDHAAAGRWRESEHLGVNARNV